MWLMLLGKGSLFRMDGRGCRQEAGERIKTSSTCGVAKVWIEREGGHASGGAQHFAGWMGLMRSGSHLRRDSPCWVVSASGEGCRASGGYLLALRGGQYGRVR